MNTDTRAAAIRALRFIPSCGFLLTLLLVLSSSAMAVSFTSGDVLVTLVTGEVQIRAADGTLKGTLSGGIAGQAKGIAMDAAGDVYVSYWLSPDQSTGNTILKFHPNGAVAEIFGAGYSCNPSGIVIDQAGNVYVGQGSCTGDILKFDAAGNLLHAYNVATEVWGARWLDLDAGACVVFYTSGGLNVNRYNVCTNTQLSNFNNVAFVAGSAALGLRVLPDGGVIVSTTTQLLKLDSTGNLAGTYDAVGEDGFAGVTLDPDGHSFWTASYTTGMVYKFDIQTGAIVQSFTIGYAAKSVLVVPAAPAPPVIVPLEGRMTGGGNFMSSTGEVVHHGFQLRCSATDPRQNLEINWGTGQRFHLESVTAVTCYDNPSIDPENPAAPIDTLVLSGAGRLNGRMNATIQLTFTDAGEPGINDGVQLVIKDGQGKTVFDVPATTLSLGGNHQAHRAIGVQSR
jgi:DNA-binding beta-propeller fold protein YncE